ncbi:MAG: hypothetical protein WBE74_21435 [Terracidiphilus sp.]
MDDRRTYQLFEALFRGLEFFPKFAITEIGEMTVCHGVASNLEASVVEFPQLTLVKKMGRPDESGNDEKRSVESCFAKHRRSNEEIGFGSVIEREGNAAMRAVAQVVKRLTHAYSAQSCGAN